MKQERDARFAMFAKIQLNQEVPKMLSGNVTRLKTDHLLAT